MFKLGLASLSTLILAFSLTSSGCQAAENAFNCDAICDRYKDCFDADYDDGACADSCRDQAEDDGFADQAESCEACIDDRSCIGSFACIDECAGIVP
jgi:hypothetical protein